MTVVASNYARKENDLYQTEPWATEALLRHFPVKDMDVWEPAAGNHLMADVLRENGAQRVWTSDIETYDREHDQIFDFLGGPVGPHYFDAIITNPPYGKGNRDAVKFAELALLRGYEGMVALLLPAKFGKTRLHLFGSNPRFLAQIVLMDGDDLAWYVWGTSGDEEAAPTIIYERRTTVCAGEVATR